MGMTYFAVMILVATSVINSGFSLLCFSCDPGILSEAACGDPFNETLGAKIMDCEGTGIVCTKIVARSTHNMSAVVVGRSCSSKGGQTCNAARDHLQMLGNKLSFCKTCDMDLCNTTTRASSTQSTCLVFFLVAMQLFYINLYI